MKLRPWVRQVSSNFTVLVILLMLGSFAFAANAQSRCSVVKILSGKQVEARNFSQQGVGWVYSWAQSAKKGEDLKLNIVVPAHVVFEADKVFAQCNDEMVELFLKGISPSYDLAVLGFSNRAAERKSFVSLFKIDNSNSKDLRLLDLDKNIFIGQHTGNLTAAHFKGSKLVFTLLGIVNNDIKKEFNYQFPQYKKSILNSAGAIRPGMSGSPLFRGANSFPVGMNLKTKMNDHVSLVLPTEEILPLLPSLERGRDPWRSEHPFYEIGFYHQLDAAKKELKRYRQILIWNSQSKLIERYFEQCNFGSMVETTNWSQADSNVSTESKINTSNSRTNWEEFFKNKVTEKASTVDKSWQVFKGDKVKNKTSGGSWGDSGGGLNGKASDQSLYTDDYNNSSEKNSVEDSDWLLKKIMFSGNSQYFLSKETCSKEGLITETYPATALNKILIGSTLQLKDKSVVTIKVDSLEALLLVFIGEEKVKGRENFSKATSKNRIYKGDERASLKLICNKDLFGPNLKVYGNRVDDSESQTLLPSRPWNDFDIKSMFEQKASDHMLLVREKKYLSKTDKNDVVYLECDSDGESMDIVAENKDWSYRFNIKDGKLSGHFSISYIDNTYKIDGDRVVDGQLWKYIAEDPARGYKIEVALDPLNDPLVSVRFLEIPEAEKLKHSFYFNNTVPSLEFMESLWYLRN